MLQDILINIDVDNSERAVKFYTEALGFKIGRRFDSKFIELIGSSFSLFLLENETGTLPYPGAMAGRNYSRHWSPVHLDFVVSSIAESKKQVLSAGAKLETDIRIEPYGKLATFSDPFGHGFCLIEFTGRGYDEIKKL
ncbi:glyoxalase [Bdellovibrio bacteriovorus]|uniref:Glyoxalase n=1 Tax=Bdellovibrio bacteriovorus TaxID=959 RepID=A0A161QEC1_BDEBC|nr:VOC family protein [Bdellovibrio bacteriovorus]KYG62537.1 glyoxalase [Bdellovibrio bacteriovorus]